MGCCASSLKLDTNRSLNGSVYASKRSRSGSSGSGSSNSGSSCGSGSSNSSGLGSSCSTPQRNRSIWSRSQTRPICDDFAEQPLPQLTELEAEHELERSCGYHTCSSDSSTPSKQQQQQQHQQLYRTQDMELANQSQQSSSSSSSSSLGVGNLEWEMYMMQHAQRIMPKTSSPICQRRDATFELNSRSYHKWRNYLQSTPAHMLHNVSHIPEAIAGHFCPNDFPAFSDLEEMESAAKRFKIDTNASVYAENYPLQQHLTHTISTDL
ncbi:protein rtoA [Drosophila montana]|uniref:protein rtoA n=1 Tax=Drosophila montana TaxID=40370 RepID=UPI00313EA738